MATFFAGMAIVGLLLILPIFFRLPQLGLPPFGAKVAYVSAGTITLCCLAVLISMLAGLAGDWSESSKMGMAIAIFLTVPGALAAIGLLYLGLAVPMSASAYFVFRGVVFGTVFGLPAVLVVILAMPGHA